MTIKPRSQLFQSKYWLEVHMSLKLLASQPSLCNFVSLGASNQSTVVQRGDNSTIHWTNRCYVDQCWQNKLHYSVDSPEVWVIDQVWGQDGWILAKFFFCVFMDWDKVEVHNLAKKERGQYPAILTEQTWSIKDLLYGFWGNFACGIQRVVRAILPARVANHSARFGSSCPLAELAI